MARKVFTYRGKTEEELAALSLNEFMEMVPSRLRRSLKRGFTESQKALLDSIRKGGGLRTHARNMVIIPEMIGKTIEVYSGNSFDKVMVTGEMVGQRLGEFSLTRKKIAHGSAGVGATRSGSGPKK